MALSDKATKAIQRKEQQKAERYKRQDDILQARIRGETFREIAHRTRRTATEVHRDYQQALNRLAPIEHIEDYRRVTIARLEAIVQDAIANCEFAESQKEWHTNVDVILKTTDRLVKVTGLDKHEPEAGTTIDLKVTFEDIEHSLKALVKNDVIDVESWIEKDEGESTHPEIEAGTVESDDERKDFQ